MITMRNYDGFSPDDELLSMMKAVNHHPVFELLKDRSSVSIFMRNHVFAVWDFMSLVKSIQGFVAPSHTPWIPNPKNSIVRAINEVVLSEESDLHPDGVGSISHYELYLKAMEELEIPIDEILAFVEDVSTLDLEEAFERRVPSAALTFVAKTFETIEKQNPLEIACWFAYGREQIIPGMFVSTLKELGVSKEEAPGFHYYLQRHIELDGGDHGDFAQDLVSHFCDGNPALIQRAQEYCKEAIRARVEFWDAVQAQIQKKRDKETTNTKSAA